MSPHWPPKLNNFKILYTSSLTGFYSASTTTVWNMLLTCTIYIHCLHIHVNKYIHIIVNYWTKMFIKLTLEPNLKINYSCWGQICASSGIWELFEIKLIIHCSKHISWRDFSFLEKSWKVDFSHSKHFLHRLSHFEL